MSDSQDSNSNKPVDKHNIAFALSQAAGEKLEKAGNTVVQASGSGPLAYVINQASGSATKKPFALAFTENPAPTDNYLGLYKSKRRLLPDEVLKQIRITDHLVASILRARGSMMSLFGHLKKDRFDVGVEIIIKPDFYQVLTPDQFTKVRERIKRFEQLLLNCGHTEGLEQQDRMTLAEFMSTQAENGLSFGRFATEVIYDRNGEPDDEGNYPFHRFRPRDVATIYRAVRKGEYAGNTLRVSAIRALESITGEKINIDFQELKADKYAWLQVIDGTPRQAFTHDEMLIFNLFPSTDVELNGYPVSPLDTIVNSVTTHISIDAYKKLYFQNGRATKGMLVIRSDEVDQQMLDNVKLQFNASINSVSNSFRTPIFGIGKEDEIDWLSMAGEGARDADFQFMYDQIARNILSAFSISPDELPGYSHLSRGTNSQTLSECFDPESYLLTNKGYKKAIDLLEDKEEIKNIQIWTGQKWEKARLFWTGDKELRETISRNGLKIKTSPDHRFRVIGEKGLPVWKEQRDLKLGDTIIVNKTMVEGDRDIVPYFKGRQITPDLMEYLGWLTGDGSIIDSKKRAGAYIKSYYHPEKEADIQEKHALILLNFGLDVHKIRKELSEKEKNNIVEYYGFNNVLDFRLYNVLYNTEFVKWLKEIGFSTSKEGKTIPSFLHSAPIEYRAAFLRGLFSADGHASTNGQIILTIQNEEVRESVRQLLIGMGIRTLPYKGINRRSGFTNGKTFSHKLSIKDTNIFWQYIGFNQKHKQDRKKQKLWTIGSLPENVMKNMSQLLLDKANNNIEKTEHDILVSASQGKRKTTKEYIIKIAQKIKLELPKWFMESNFDVIDQLIDHNKTIEMVDIEVFNNEHMFMLNGFMVHNSSNEFKLTAARDTGLRPLILKFQTFFNQRLFPIIDPLLAKICEVRFSGIDAQSKEQESTRLQQDMAIHMHYDELLHEVDKDPVGKSLGGEIPFNERWQIIADKYINVGKIKSAFMADAGAIVDPILQYKRDPFFLQWLQLLSQINPAAVQAYFAPKPFALDFLKMEIDDILEDDNHE